MLDGIKRFLGIRLRQLSLSEVPPYVLQKPDSEYPFTPEQQELVRLVLYGKVQPEIDQISREQSIIDTDKIDQIMRQAQGALWLASNALNVSCPNLRTFRCLVVNRFTIKRIGHMGDNKKVLIAAEEAIILSNPPSY